MLLNDELLLNYKRCQRRAFLDLHGQMPRDPEREFLLKLRQESRKHNQNVLETFDSYHQPQGKDWQQRSQATEALMQQGVDCIYRGVLRLTSQDRHFGDHFPITADDSDITLIGTPSLLVKQPGFSQYGDWQYRPISIQLGRRPKSEYKLVSAFHGQLLAAIQENWSPASEIILRQQNRYRVYLKTWVPRLHEVLSQCVQTLSSEQTPEVFISRQRCSLCHWYSHCYAIASQQNHLSLVPGVTPQRYQHLQSLGVVTVESLASTCSIYIGEVLGFEVASSLKQQAEAIVADRALLKSNHRQTLPTASVELYFDIEAEPERHLDYLLGVLLVDRHSNTKQFYPFLAEHPDEEAAIWQQFLTFVSAYAEAPIFHYSEYEVETIRRLGILYKTPRKQIEQLLTRFVDLHHSVVSSVVLPVESYSLKSLANWLGFGWRDATASGEQSVCWYDQWLKQGDRAFLEAILRYNEDDCRATHHLKDWLVDLLDSQ